jgi:hypothetical protein
MRSPFTLSFFFAHLFTLLFFFLCKLQQLLRRRTASGSWLRTLASAASMTRCSSGPRTRSTSRPYSAGTSRARSGTGTLGEGCADIIDRLVLNNSWQYKGPSLVVSLCAISVCPVLAHFFPLHHSPFRFVLFYRYKLQCRLGIMGYNAWVHDADGAFLGDVYAALKGEPLKRFQVMWQVRS